MPYRGIKHESHMNKIVSSPTLQRIRSVAEKKVISFRRTITQDIIKEKIFFLHVPKCGGTSTDAAIQKAYRWKACVHLNSRASQRSAQFLKEEMDIHRNQILPYFLEQELLKYVSGHFVFDEDIFEKYSPQWNFVTLLRNPVDKYISQYFYNSRKDSHQHFAINESLDEYIETDEGKSLGNDLVRRFAGKSFRNNLKSSQKKAIDQAVENLKKFRLVGLLEEMDSFISGFKHCFNATLRVKQKNKNPEKKESAISPEILNEIENLCENDLEVYHKIRNVIL